jgi:hypothetical protein
MEKLEAVRLALAELGDAPAAELAAFVRARYGVEVQPGLIPVSRATLRDREQLERARAGRAGAAELGTAGRSNPPEQPGPGPARLPCS